MKIELVAPEADAVVPLLNAAQKLYQRIPRDMRERLYVDSAFRLTLSTITTDPVPVALEWRADDISTNAAITYRVTVTRCGPSEDKVFFCEQTTETRIDVWNLEIARQYVWRVEAYDGVNKIAGSESTFSTEDFAPRLLKVDNVPNFRDFGGRIGINGRRVRQGMLFRSQGLNFNARTVYYTEEEILASESGADCEAERCLMRADITKMERLKGDIESIRFVHADIGTDWTVFRLENGEMSQAICREIRNLREIPQGDLFGNMPEIRVAKDGVVAIPIVIPMRTAVFMREFQADDDGYIPLSCGADWWFEVICNGEVSFSRFIDGNGCRVSPDCHVTLLKVNKGKNLLTAIVKAGSEGWSWCYRTPDAFSAKDLIDSRIAADRRVIDGIFGNVVKEIVPGECRLAETGKKYLIEDLGIRTELDLRSPGECYGMTESPLGNGVRWINSTSHAYVEPGTPLCDAPFIKNFRLLLDDSVYPLDFHCIGGRDRTGIFAAILGMLLGVSEDEMCLEWEMSSYKSFDMAFIHRDTYDIFKNGLAKYEGASWTEKAKNYAISVGFTMDDIRHFREIMLEPLD